MKSQRIIPGDSAVVSNINALRSDARAASWLHSHQMLGTLFFGANPTNGQTLTLDINGNNVVLTFVTSIGTAAGNVLIGSNLTASILNAFNLLEHPTVTTATGVALSATNAQLVTYVQFSLNGGILSPCSVNSTIYSPLTSFSASTTVSSSSYTAQTMSLYVEPGVFFIAGTRYVFNGGSPGTVTAPSTHPRIDVLSIDNTGTLNWTVGTENASPTVPAYPSGQLALAEVYNVVGETALEDYGNQISGQGYIYNDVRPYLGGAVNFGAVPYSILPLTTNTYNLGSSSKQWNIGYFNTILQNGVGVPATMGIFSFGEDASVTFDGSTTILGMAPSSSVYTMTRDIFCVNITVNLGVTIQTNGYAIYCQGTLTNGGTISCNGSAGSNGASVSGATGSAGGAGGAATNSGTLKGGVAGVAGGIGGNGGGPSDGAGQVGNAGASGGTNVTNSLGSNNGTVGGTSGGGGAGSGSAAGSGTTANGTVGTLGVTVQGPYSLIQLMTMSSIALGVHTPYTSSPTGTGGAGGGGGGSAAGSTGQSGGGGGGGGGAASSGGIMLIFANTITNTGTIECLGGVGGNGANGGAGVNGSSSGTGGGGGGGGGAGGNGGICIIAYVTLTNTGTISVAGGAGGTAGSGGAHSSSGGSNGSAGSNGSNGASGTIIEITL